MMSSKVAKENQHLSSQHKTQFQISPPCWMVHKIFAQPQTCALNMRSYTFSQSSSIHDCWDKDKYYYNLNTFLIQTITSVPSVTVWKSFKALFIYLFLILFIYLLFTLKENLLAINFLIWLNVVLSINRGHRVFWVGETEWNSWSC